jgi:hypothetical protein
MFAACSRSRKKEKFAGVLYARLNVRRKLFSSDGLRIAR